MKKVSINTFQNKLVNYSAVKMIKSLLLTDNLSFELKNEIYLFMESLLINGNIKAQRRFLKMIKKDDRNRFLR